MGVNLTKIIPGKKKTSTEATKAEAPAVPGKKKDQAASTSVKAPKTAPKATEPTKDTPKPKKAPKATEEAPKKEPKKDKDTPKPKKAPKATEEAPKKEPKKDKATLESEAFIDGPYDKVSRLFIQTHQARGTEKSVKLGEKLFDAIVLAFHECGLNLGDAKNGEYSLTINPPKAKK